MFRSAVVLNPAMILNMVSQKNQSFRQNNFQCREDNY